MWSKCPPVSVCLSFSLSLCAHTCLHACMCARACVCSFRFVEFCNHILCSFTFWPLLFLTPSVIELWHNNNSKCLEMVLLAKLTFPHSLQISWIDRKKSKSRIILLHPFIFSNDDPETSHTKNESVKQISQHNFKFSTLWTKSKGWTALSQTKHWYWY